MRTENAARDRQAVVRAERRPSVSFVFVAFHWPEPDHRDTLARSMREMRDLLLDTPGCLAVESPLLTRRPSGVVSVRVP